MAAPPMGLTELAPRIAAQADEDIRWRLLLGFLDEFAHTDSALQAASITDEPTTTNDRKWDVMMAAVAEHVAYANDLPIPMWVRKPEREWLGYVWWVVELPSARPWALAHSPAAFRRRGIFLHPDDIAVA
jgi:hypothetical protein